ncbi:MAG: flavin reductase [Gammaproteobacteria bacterium]|nr:MAG: flavin reductase [Gammaproteobacteria bacterium]
MTQQEQFKLAMSQFATGVCVMTFEHPETKATEGVTISAFSSLSVEPLKILFCLGHWGLAKTHFDQIERFTVNILSSRQKDLAYQFAGRSRDHLADKIEKIDGTPSLKGTLASVVCQKGSHYTEGDHDIIIGEVQSIQLNNADNSLQPLLYYRSDIIDNYRYES